VGKHVGAHCKVRRHLFTRARLLALAVVVLGLVVATSAARPAWALFSSGTTSTTSVSLGSVTPMADVSGSVSSSSFDPVVAQVAVGLSPEIPALDDSTNQVWVPNDGSETISVIDESTNKVAEAIPLTSSAEPTVGPLAVAIDQSTQTAYALVQGQTSSKSSFYSVMVINAKTYAIVTSITSCVESAGDDLAIDDATDTIYEACYYSDGDVAVIDGATNTVKYFTVGGGPTGIAYDPVTNDVLVAESADDDIAVIDASTNTVTGTIPVGGEPYQIAIDRETGTAWVTDYDASKVFAVDPSNDAVSSVQVLDGEASGVSGIAVDDATGMVYATTSYSGDGVLLYIDASTDSNTGEALTPNNPNFVVVNPSTDLIYTSDYAASEVTVVDGVAAPYSVVPVGAYPGNIGVDPSTDIAWVANSNSGTVSEINGATDQVVATITVGSDPWDAAVDDATDTVYVTNSDSGTVSVIDGTTGTVTATIDVGSGPYGVAVDQKTGTVYVTNGGSDTVSVIDGATGTVTATIAVGSDPYAVAVDDVSDTVYVVNKSSGTMSVIDGASNTVSATVSLGSSTAPIAVAVDPIVGQAYVVENGSDELVVVSLATNTVTTTITEGANTGNVTVDASANAVYVTNFTAETISVIDASTDQVASTMDAGASVFGVAVDPETGVLFIGYVYNGFVGAISPTDDVAVSWSAPSSPIVLSCEVLGATSSSGPFQDLATEPCSQESASITTNYSWLEVLPVYEEWQGPATPFQAAIA